MHDYEDQFEQDLKQALERRPAPPGLKAKIMAARWQRRKDARHSHSLLWMRLAASLLIAALIGGGVRWDYERIQQRRRGEEARQQVLTALRITGHALNLVQERLAAHNSGNGD
jgi:hypothetical protein